jgi:hypothetical protein
MAASPMCPRAAASDVDYWLRRCEGFRVHSPEVGFAEAVRYASRRDRPDVTHLSPRPTATERWQGLRERVRRGGRRRAANRRWRTLEPEPNASKPNGRWRW